MKRFTSLLAILLLLLAGCSAGQQEAKSTDTLRLGYLANLTHAQALLGMADGSLEKAAGVKITTRVFTAGPAAITALLAGEIDLLYVGPSPAVIGYIRSEGKALRVIAGGASGGALFVTRPGFDPQHLEGARLATPGLANTQDIALRHMLAERGLRTRQQGGSVTVTALAPADLLTMMQRGQIDGAWVAEPWGSRLVKEAGARIEHDERDLWPDRRFATTVLAVHPDYLARNREAVLGFLQGHVALTGWIRSHPDEARTRLQAEMARIQGKPMPDDLIRSSLERIDFVTDPMAESVWVQAERAFRLGYLGARQPDLTGLYDLSLLKEVAP